MTWRKTLLKIFLGLILLGAILASMVARFLVRGSSTPVVLPTPSGSYAVGRVAYDWVDELRPAVVEGSPASGESESGARGPHAKRELMVWLWYPAPPSSSARAGAYLPGKWGEVLERDRGRYLWQRFDSVEAHSIDDAPLSPAPAPYPVLIFSTGYGRVPADYSVLAEDLASHGYVVAGIANTYSAPVVVFPDGRVARRAPEGALPETSPAVDKAAADRLVMLWAADAIFVINQMERLNAAPEGRFSGRLDLTRLGVLGHSLGGATAAEVCSRDTRCQAGVDIDGWLFGDVVKVGLSPPFMFILSEPASPRLASVLEQSRPESAQAEAEAGREIDAVYRSSAAGYKITLGGAGHFNFTDSALLFSPIMKITGELGPIDGRRGLEVTGDYLRAFFGQYLNHENSALLAGPSPRYPEAGFESHARQAAVSPASPTAR